MLGALDQDEIEDVLRSEILGRIGCIVDGWPYVVPVTYAYDGESVYVHSAEGHKLRAMRANPQVCFEVERIRSATNWQTVIARGRFEPLWRDINSRAMDLLATRFATGGPSATAGLDRNEKGHRAQGVVRPVLYRIRLLNKTGRFERS
jgi:nitroimidazol reductase NimA-like FMN-containing flavoprotein (pyridoxamine 5'-phosphate oxidase superfamily)